MGDSHIDAYRDLKSVNGEQAPSYETFSRWVVRFRNGRVSFEDGPHSNRLITAHTQKNIEAIRMIINENPHSTYYDIEALTSLSNGAIFSIKHDSLKLRKITSRWIPNFLNEQNRKERVEACRENLRVFKEGNWRLYDVVTGDESWIIFIHIRHKQYNASWIVKANIQKQSFAVTNSSPKSCSVSSSNQMVWFVYTF